MLARKSCPFEKAIHTVKTNHMVECTITMWEKQVIEIKINIVDIKVTGRGKLQQYGGSATQR